MNRGTKFSILALLIGLCMFTSCGNDRLPLVKPAGPQDNGTIFRPPPSGDTPTAQDIWTPPPGNDVVSTDTWEYLLPPCGDEAVEVSGEAKPANIMIIMDRSGSMEGQKWTETQDAVGSVLSTFDQFIHFGLLLYPQNGSSCVQTPLLDVSFGLNQGQTIVDTMITMGTGGGTPTAGGLQAAAQVFMSTPLVGDRYVIVATDGSPNCLIDCNTCPNAGCLFGCEACLNEDPCVRDEVMTAVQNLKIMGIPTFVVGIAGSQAAEEILNAMAIVGGTAKATYPKYYDTTNASQLTEVLTAILGSVGSCSVQLNKTPGSLFLVVDINGQTVERDETHQNGWDLVDGDILQFYGPACELASIENSDITVTYVCKYADQ